MPLYDVECAAGHRSEVFKRGASNGPSACPTCGDDARRVWNGFAFRVQGDVVLEPAYSTKAKTSDPEVIERMGGGRAVKTKDGGYRPALTHTAKCPKCARRRNVAIVNQLPEGPRLMCEGCGYTWIHGASTASDPLLKGFDPALRPGKVFGKTGAPAYEEPARAV